MVVGVHGQPVTVTEIKLEHVQILLLHVVGLFVMVTRMVFRQDHVVS